MPKIYIFCDKKSIKIKFDVVHDHHHIVHILKWLCCCSSSFALWYGDFYSHGTCSTLVSGIQYGYTNHSFLLKENEKVEEKREQISDAWWFHVPSNDIFLPFKSLKQQFSNNFYLNLFCFIFFSEFNFEKFVIIDGGCVAVGTYRQFHPTFPFWRIKMLMKLQ